MWLDNIKEWTGPSVDDFLDLGRDPVTKGGGHRLSDESSESTYSLAR